MKILGPLEKICYILPNVGKHLKHLKLHQKLGAWLAQSAGRVQDSRSQGCGFGPHTGCRVYLKKQNLKKTFLKSYIKRNV